MRISRRHRWFALVIAFVIAGCQPAPPPEPVPTVAPPATAEAPQSLMTARMEEEVLERINAIRAEHGEEPLRYSAELTRVAREYSRQMTVENFFSHHSPAGEDVTDRLRQAGLDYTHVGENIFQVLRATRGQIVDTAVEGWMESPGHRRNILRGFEKTGVGVWHDGDTYYLTQVFFSG